MRSVQVTPEVDGLVEKDYMNALEIEGMHAGWGAPPPAVVHAGGDLCTQ